MVFSWILAAVLALLVLAQVLLAARAMERLGPMTPAERGEAVAGLRRMDLTTPACGAVVLTTVAVLVARDDGSWVGWAVAAVLATLLVPLALVSARRTERHVRGLEVEEPTTTPWRWGPAITVAVAISFETRVLSTYGVVPPWVAGAGLLVSAVGLLVAVPLGWRSLRGPDPQPLLGPRRDRPRSDT